MQVRLEGSIIPSNSLYVSRERALEYDMLTASCEEIEAFMGAENIPAPARQIVLDQYYETDVVYAEGVEG